MRKIYSTWTVLILIIVVVSLYHLYAFTEKYDDKDNNILGVPTDQNAVIPGTLTVTADYNNQVGKSLFPDDNGDVRIRPNEARSVVVGEKAAFNLIGENSTNRLGQASWFPYTDKNTYIRGGTPDSSIYIGDAWANLISIGANGAPVQLGPDTFISAADGNTYIRPRANNGTVNLGDFKTSQVNIGTNSSRTRLRGRVQFGPEDKSDNSDPYYLEKITNGWDNSSLRLTINDTSDETFEIWGNSCGSAGGCGGPGVRQHTFQADGTARHASKVCAGNQCLNEADIRAVRRVAGLSAVNQ